mgnify:FL=1
MTYILLIVLTLSDPEKESKDIELRITYSNKEEYLKASKKIDFSFKFPGKEIKTKSECIPKDASKGNENLET